MSSAQVAGGGLEALMTSISDAIQTRDQAALGSIIENIVKNNEVARNMLSQSITLGDNDIKSIHEATGTKLGRNISGVNVHAALGEMMRSLDEYTSRGLHRIDQIAQARGPRIKMSEMSDAIGKIAAGGVNKKTGGIMANVSKMKQATDNLLTSLGKGIIKNHKAIGLGFAGSLALSAVLSKPQDTLGPLPPGPDPQGLMNKGKASGNMTQESLHPPTSVGEPSAPPVPFRNDARINFGPSQQVNVKARTSHTVHPSEVSSQLSTVNNGSVSVDIRDRRNSLNEHQIANKLME